MSRKAKGVATKGASDVVSLRLDGKRRRAVARVARERHMSPSEIIRGALDALLEKAEASSRPYDGWNKVIGAVRDAPPDLSERTGSAFAEALRGRKRS